MKFILIEGKKEIQVKYGEHLLPEYFDHIYNTIPENLKGYGDWIFKNVLEKLKKMNIPNELSAYVYDVIGIQTIKLSDALRLFVKYKGRLEVKDINKYSSKEDVEKAIEYAKQKGSRKEKAHDAEVVYEDDNVKVLIPLTHEASRHYGTGTNWCTATANPEHFSNYQRKGKIFYILPKSGDDKYAIYVPYTLDHLDIPDIEAFDKEDNEAVYKDIIKRLHLPKELFSGYLGDSNKDKNGIETILRFLKIENFKIHDNLVVDVDEDVDLLDQYLKEIPLKFGVVKGSFRCGQNKLISLEGAPRIVEKSFNCAGNDRLKSLKGAPEIVGGRFYCSYNYNLISLKGSPKEVGAWFSCSNNPNLVSLKGMPKELGGDFYCSDNPKLPKSEVEKAVKKYGKENVFSDYVFEYVFENVNNIKFKVVEGGRL